MGAPWASIVADPASDAPRLGPTRPRRTSFVGRWSGPDGERLGVGAVLLGPRGWASVPAARLPGPPAAHDHGAREPGVARCAPAAGRPQRARRRRPGPGGLDRRAGGRGVAAARRGAPPPRPAVRGAAAPGGVGRPVRAPARRAPPRWGSGSRSSRPGRCRRSRRACAGSRRSSAMARWTTPRRARSPRPGSPSGASSTAG